MPALPVDLANERYGRLVVKERLFIRANYLSPLWICICDCGNKVRVHMSNLRRKENPTRSCGCIQKEVVTKHGMSSSLEHGVWKAMKDRCYNEKHPHFDDYGGRGITVDDEWRESFEIFIRDMGFRPTADHTLERRNNNEGYSKANCYWATRIEQANNRRSNVHYEFNDQKKTLAEWCRELNLNYNTALFRIHAGWPLKKVFA